MSNKKLIILALIAIVMIALVMVQSRVSDKPGQSPPGPVYLIQGLDPADIGSIVLGAGENSITLKREASHFVITGKDGYTAVTNKVNELITQCLDIRTSELYTDDKTNHADLGVTEEKAQTIVKFFKPDSSLLTGVIIGQSREGDKGAFVRLSSDDKVYVTLEKPWINSDVMYYINQQLFSLNEDDIASVTVSGPDDVYTLEIEKDSGDIVLENAPEGKKLKADAYEAVFRTLTSLRFNDVKKQSNAEKPLNFEHRYTCRLKDSTVYTLNIAKTDDKTYMTCRADFTDTRPVTKEKAVETERELRIKEAKLLAKDEAEDFTAKHKDWIYDIPAHKVLELTRALSEILEDEPATPSDSNEPEE